MKTISLIIIAFLLCAACNAKGPGAEEEGAYNPYDTSELENIESSSDTIYTMDSVAKSFKLHELNLKN